MAGERSSERDSSPASIDQRPTSRLAFDGSAATGQVIAGRYELRELVGKAARLTSTGHTTGCSTASSR